ncbi:uncharacterized protein LOC120923257 [Rana temporaria]|uniref:uncharacterized protein LOC120923257 n=1 Tax=Rana temporaria TaxID=8407 RepID=UPI001AADBF51|nr:uncharacterized protein LOC120923257 [Rana temporaria]
METCPFCGKAFKRLKTHLPHCKATEQAKKSPKTGKKKTLLVEAKEQNLKKKILQNPKEASSLAPADPLHVAVTPPQALPGGSKFLKASEDNWTWPDREADFRGAKGKSRSAGVKSTVYEKVSKKALLEETKEQCIKNKVLQNPKVASSLAPTDPPHVAVTPPQTSAVQALPGGPEFLKASEDNWTWPNPEADFRVDIGKSRSDDVKSTVYEEVSKKALLVEAKEQNLKKNILQNPKEASSLAPADPLHVAVTPPQALPGGSKFLKASEDNWTWPHREADFRGAIRKSRSDGVKSTVYEDVSKKALLEEAKEQCLKNKVLQNPKEASSLAPTDPLHVAVTPPQTSALQALPGGSKFLKASENNFTWPNYKGDFRGALEKTANIGIKSPLYEEVSKKSLLVEAKEQYLNKEGDDTMETTKKAQPFNESLFQKLKLPSEPNSSFLPSTMVFSSHRPHSEFPRHGDHVQLPHISRQLQTHESDALKSMEKSLEGQLDLTPANETKTALPVRDPLSRNCSLGLQWIPELHSNYIQLKIVPEQIDLKSSRGRMGKSIAPGPFDPESCRPTQRPPIPEVPLTSRRLMNVRIGELPSWLALQRLSMNTIPELGVKAWTRYYNKYINVRKGGIGGLAMLLTGYCVLSYSWNYRRIRQDRWRKYH